MSDYLDWTEDASCGALPLEESERLFFGTNLRDRAKGKEMCGLCPVSIACLADALIHEVGDRKHRAGLRGGLSPEERAALMDVAS